MEILTKFPKKNENFEKQKDENFEKNMEITSENSLEISKKMKRWKELQFKNQTK